MAVVFALTAVVIVGVGGTALDFGRALSDRTKLQAAMDSAVMAAVQKPAAEHQSTAQAFLAINFVSGHGSPPTATFITQADGGLIGTATTSVPTTLVAILGVDELVVDVSSHARPSGDPESPPPCFNVLDPDKWYGLRLRDSANISGTECEVHVHSTRDDSAAGFEDSSNVEFKRVCLAGGADTPIVNKEELCAVAPDSFQGTLPAVTVGACAHNNATFNLPNQTLNPGVYCGTTNITSAVTNLTLNPGLYVVSGGTFTLSAQDITGSGVTFYFADVNASLTMSNVNSGTLSAPTSGIYQDILMFQATGLELPDLEINGVDNQNWSGIIHLPGAEVGIRNATNWTWNVNLVAWTMEIRDAVNWTVATQVGAKPAVGATLVN